MSMINIINKAAVKESKKYSTIVFTLIIPRFLEEGKKIHRHFFEIVFEYDLAKKEPVSNITQDLKAQGNLIGYPYISDHQLKILNNNIEYLIKSGRKGSYVKIKLTDLKHGFDLILVKGKTTTRKFAVTTAEVPDSPPKKTVHRLKGTNSFGKSLPKPKTRTVRRQRTAIPKSSLSKRLNKPPPKRKSSSSKSPPKRKSSSSKSPPKTKGISVTRSVFL
jgi:hypothetical protein